MKKLNELCKKLPCQIVGDTNLRINGISYNSQKTKPGDLFVAINGYKTSGKLYIESAIKHGASAIATDDESLIKRIVRQYNHKIANIYITNPRQFLAILANRFYDFPSKKLTLIGITGTNGKTTTSYMIKSIIEKSGMKTGLLGTIKYFDGTNWTDAPNTTPESSDFISFLAELVKKNIHFCISEISSHALVLDRVFGLDFKVGVFTNLAHDHLDFHKTKKAYGEAKLKLFKNLSSSAFAVVNYDDKFAKKIIENTKAKIIGYSLNKKNDINAAVKNTTTEGIEILVTVENKSKPLTINFPMLGRHNIYNMLAAIGTTKTFGISNRFIKNGIEKFDSVPGRLERIRTDRGYNVYIDYAHTAEALEVAIKSLKEITPGKTIVVFGCGGNRDCLKRPKMGRITTELADYAIITSDNPRYEDPNMIINDIKKGIKKNNYKIISDRAQAVKHALRCAKPKDAVLIAGKGHEQYQIIGDKVIPFSDKEIVLKELSKRKT